MQVCDGDGDGELEANAAKLAWEHHLSFMSQFGLEPTTAQARAQREHQAAAPHAAAAQAGHGGHNRPGNRPSSSAGAHASSSATLHAQNPVSMPGAHTAAATGRSRPGSSGGGSGARQQLSGEPSFGSQQQHAMNSMPPAQHAGHVHAQQRQMQMQQEMPPMDATMTRSLAGVSQTLDLLRLDRQLGHGQYQQAPMHGATAAQGEPGAGHRHTLSASTSAGPAPASAPNGSAWPGFEQQAPGPDAHAAYCSGLNPQSSQAASGFRPADSTMRGGLAGTQHPITSQPHSHHQSVRQASLPSGSGCHETSLQGRTNTSGVQAAMGDVGGEVLVRDVAHADGKLEQVYASGKRKVSFPNGTCKVRAVHP